MLPYILGCPSWAEPAWLGSAYPKGTPSNRFLAHYCALFNGVEGNTTFYARPSEATVQRWASIMPESFRFCAKFPQDISHAEDLRVQCTAAADFLTLLQPLGPRLNPVWLQLPARFGAARLSELVLFLEALVPLGTPIAVEVRHAVFFERGEPERFLNRLLRDQGVERIGLDTRALFHCQSREPAVLHAQSRKPRLPARAAALTSSPQVRFIGHPELAANDAFLAPWVEKIAQWIEEGRTPHMYVHTPDNHQAPELALRFHRQLQTRLPGLQPLEMPSVEESLQSELF